MNLVIYNQDPNNLVMRGCIMLNIVFGQILQPKTWFSLASMFLEYLAYIISHKALKLSRYCRLSKLFPLYQYLSD